MSLPTPSDARRSLHRKLQFWRFFRSGVGCFFGIAIVAYLSSTVHNALLIPSFGATCVLGIVTPTSTFSQPRNVIGGHLVSSLVGILCVALLGVEWWSIAVAVGLSSLLMQLSRTLHPPAAGDPVFFISHNEISFSVTLFGAIMGSCLLVGFFYLFHRWLVGKEYPQYWW